MNNTPQWVREHECCEPACVPGDCTIDRWYPRAALSGHVRQTIVLSLQKAYDNGYIAPIEYRLAILELKRDQ